MSSKNSYSKRILDRVNNPSDLKSLNINQLQILSQEIREEVIAVVSQIGGHLGASLGVIELTVALHYVFDTPNDLLVWDIGHQTYPHKILTERKNVLSTLRQPGGISGFTKRAESIYDTFGAGHSSTSISAALGMAVARDLNYKQHDVLAVIGDGAISAGMAYEAMNNAGNMKSRLIVILNDNKMSIAPAVGAMSQYLCRLLSSSPYLNIRNIAKNILHHMPNTVENLAKKAKKYAKDFTTGGNFFEEIGFHYIGAIDGHDLEQLILILKNIKNNDSINSPILLHIVTEKGKGFDSQEKSPENYHAVKPFDITTKIQKKSCKPNLTYTQVFANTLVHLAQQDSSIVGITAAMPSGTGMDIFARKFPTRMFDVGIAEQHAVTFAAGLAVGGLKPFVAVYSTFLQRAYDQVIHDVAIQSLPVRFAIDRAGLVGADGPTHAGSFDIAYLACLPNFIIMVPSDAIELARMVVTAYNINDKPSAIRFPRAEIPDQDIINNLESIIVGKARIINKGSEIAILSLGTRLEEVLQAANIIRINKGLDITVADARFAKPIDENLIQELASTHRILITIEEGSAGGFGSHVAQFLLNKGLLDNKLKFRSMFMPDRFIEQNTLEAMYHEAELDRYAIVRLVDSLL